MACQKEVSQNMMACLGFHGDETITWPQLHSRAWRLLCEEFQILCKTPTPTNLIFFLIQGTCGNKRTKKDTLEGLEGVNKYHPFLAAEFPGSIYLSAMVPFQDQPWESSANLSPRHGIFVGCPAPTKSGWWPCVDHATPSSLNPPTNQPASQPASKQASNQRNKQTSKHESKQASKHARTHARKQASKQSSKQFKSSQVKSHHITSNQNQNPINQFNQSNQIKSNQIKSNQSNQIKSNQIKSNQIKSINQSINQSIKQTNQPINQSINLSINQSNRQTIKSHPQRWKGDVQCIL